MKKPNITDGEWWVNTLGQHHNNPDIQQHEICWSPDGECVVDHVYSLADAQAISAVPEMIDALIEAHGFIQTKIYLFKEQYPDQVPLNAIIKLNKIEQALKKAGVEL